MSDRYKVENISNKNTESTWQSTNTSPQQKKKNNSCGIFYHVRNKGNSRNTIKCDVLTLLKWQFMSEKFHHNVFKEFYTGVMLKYKLHSLSQFYEIFICSYWLIIAFFSTVEWYETVSLKTKGARVVINSNIKVK